MKWDEVSGSACHIARALSVVGDRWTLLIMREIGLTGVRRFEEIQAQTGMSSHLLAVRLKRMEESRVIERRRYCTHPDRFEYHATEEGKELDAVLLALRGWGMRRDKRIADTGPSIELTDKATGEHIDANWPFPGSRPFTFDQCNMTLSKAFEEERMQYKRKFSKTRQATRSKRLAKAPVSRSKQME